jgi:hypothetical protein
MHKILITGCLLWLFTLVIYSGHLLWSFTLVIYSGDLLWLFIVAFGMPAALVQEAAQKLHFSRRKLCFI